MLKNSKAKFSINYDKTLIVNLRSSKLVHFLVVTTLLISTTNLGAVAQTPTPTPSTSLADIKGDRYVTLHLL